MSKTFKKADIIIVGGGIVGLTQSLILGQNGFKVICLDKETNTAQKNTPVNTRTTAVSYGSHQLFKAIHIWNDLSENACPIKDIQVADGNSPTLLNFDISEDVEAKAAQGFGWVIENHFIRQVLLNAIKSEKNINLIEGQSAKNFEYSENSICVETEDNKMYEASLIIGADGRQSFTRNWMGIDVEEYDYKQRAIVSIISHERPHQNIAVENFKSSGPLAILPMIEGDKNTYRSSIVWTESASVKRSIMALDEATYLCALSNRFPTFYGDIQATTERVSYPLGLINAASYIAPRCALIGDAAHGIHPIAGQGLNLGLRDVAELTDLLLKQKLKKEDLGSEELLGAYEQNRRADNLLMIGITHHLNKLFSNNISSLKPMRKLGLRAINKIEPLKKIIRKQTMGTSGNIPRIIKEGQV